MDHDELQGIIESLIERIEKLENKVFAKKEKNQKTDGAEVWDAYSLAYFRRYGVKPVRNSATNAQAKLLVSRVGKDIAIQMVSYYLTQSDAYASAKLHPLSLCLKDCDTYYARMNGARAVSRSQANQMEQAQGNLEATKAHVKSKHG